MKLLVIGSGGREHALAWRLAHDIDTKQSAHDDYTHFDALTIENLQTAINKLAYAGVDFAKLKLPEDAFLHAIATRIKQHKEREEREQAKAAALK